jgi:CRISPR-associated protein Csb1
MTAIADAARLVVDADLEPVTGSIFQPTGFPDLGAATFRRPVAGGVVDALLVESVQSMTNHLEALGWDSAERQPAPALSGLPYVRVIGPDQAYLTSSRTEPHRLASPYVRDAKTPDGTKGTAWLIDRLGLVKGRPLDWRAVYAAIFELDALCLLHGVFFSEQGMHGNPKVRRAITAVVEAEDVAPVVSGGLKRDDVRFTADKASGRDAEAGYGFVPFGRTEFTARRIGLRIVVDLEQIDGYGLGDERTALLRDLVLWQLATLLDRPLRLRTMCDLQVIGARVTRPAEFTLPAADELAERISATSVRFEAAEPWHLVFGEA